MEDVNVSFAEVHYITIQKIGDVPLVKGDFQSLPRQVQSWIAQMVKKKMIIFYFLFLNYLGTIMYSTCCIYL
jgi:hypothetical protein